MKLGRGGLRWDQLRRVGFSWVCENPWCGRGKRVSLHRLRLCKADPDGFTTGGDRGRERKPPKGASREPAMGQSLINGRLSESDSSKARDDTRSARALRRGLPGDGFYEVETGMTTPPAACPFTLPTLRASGTKKPRLFPPVWTPRKPGTARSGWGWGVKILERFSARTAYLG